MVHSALQSSDSADTATRILEDAGFASYVSSNIASNAPFGTVAGTTPSDAAFPGSAVGLLISSGPAPAPAPVVQPRQPAQPA